jgi:hypothetical protein
MDFRGQFSSFRFCCRVLRTLTLLFKKEAGSSNPKLKRQAYSLVGVMHNQVGPPLKALVLTMIKLPTVKEEFQKCFEAHPYDPLAKSTDWPKKSIALGVAVGNVNENQNVASFEIPNTDIFVALPRDILSRLVRSQHELISL